MKLRTARLSQHASALQLSLLASLGLTLPVLAACGGSVVTQGEGVAGSGNSAGSGASSGQGASGGTSPGGGGPGGSGPIVAGAGPVYPFCERPVLDPVSGLVNCLNGFEHRPKPVKCTPPPDLGEGGADGEAGAGGAAGATSDVPDQCASDADCRYLPLGYCNTGNFGGGDAPGEKPLAYCSSGCLQDSDCTGSAICVCDGSASGGKCVPSTCTTDADCGSKQFCIGTEGTCGGTYFSCTNEGDECLSRADCNSGQTCLDFGDNLMHRRCGSGPACGRPFLIEDAPRFADVTQRTDWLNASPSPELSNLSPLQRAELAGHWSRLGQMEHASIAAFARFNLQLLALGAPAELVEACNQALIDETAHAKICFAFASAYAGTKLGPSKLDMSHCFEETTLLSVTQLVISEGCIGETVAALEALEEAEKAADPVVKSALLRIAHDERNHAELAYRFLRWAVAQCTNEQRSEIVFEVEQRLRAFEATAQRAEQTIAARRVVRPLLAALSTEMETA